MEINGELRIEDKDKIWFNDILRNRLRICGFTKDQIKKLKNSKFIDITLFDCKKTKLNVKPILVLPN